MEKRGGNCAGRLAGAQHAGVLQAGKHLLRATAAYFFGNGQSLVDTRADGGSSQIIANEPEAGELRAKLVDSGQAVAITEGVLRQGARAKGDILKNGRAGEGEPRRKFTVEE